MPARDGVNGRSAPGRRGPWRRVISRRRLLRGVVTAGSGFAAGLAAVVLPARAQPTPVAAALPALRSANLALSALSGPFRLALVDAAGVTLQAQEWATPDRAPWQYAVRGRDGALAWRALGEATLEALDTERRRMLLRVAGEGGVVAQAELDLQDASVAGVRLRLPREAGAERVAASFTASPGERYLGFGSCCAAVDFRGRRVPCQVADRVQAAGGQPRGDPDAHGSYAPIPFCLTSRGYGLLLGTATPAVFDLAASRPDTLRLECQGAELSYRALAGPSPADVVRRLSAIVGRPPLPPAWAFGVWKVALGGADAVLAQARRLRALGVPTSALFAYDLADGAANLGWPQAMFPGQPRGDYGDVAHLSGALHALGFKLMGYLSCVLRPGTPGLAEAQRRGFVLRDVQGRVAPDPVFQGGIVDLTNPDAVAWWQGLLRRVLVGLGLDGWMQDFGDTIPPEARFADGGDPAATRNHYPVLYAQYTDEAASRLAPDYVALMRAGYTGSQPYQRAVWPGDHTGDWDSAWGLPAAIRAAINQGLSGMPFCGSDIGGYFQGRLPPTQARELWIRWLQFGALSPVMRDMLGVSPAARPIDAWADDETLALFRRYATLHLALFPYLYAWAHAASQAGLPLVRHLALDFPDDPAVYAIDDQYLLGEALLVAPVVAPGIVSRRVYFPAGEWVDFWSREILPGGRWAEAPAPIDRIPLFARAGAVLPLLPSHVQTLAPATDPSVPSASLSLPHLRIDVCPSRQPRWSSAITLHDGTLLEVSGAESSGRLRLGAAPAGRIYHLALPAVDRPATVAISGRPGAAWSYDPDSQVAQAQVGVGPGESLSVGWWW